MDNAPPQPEWGIKISKFFIMPQRWILAWMAFLAIVNAYTMRVCLSQAITVLVIPRNYSQAKPDAVCEADSDDSQPVVKGGSFDWDQTTQGLILSSFYIGYIVTHLPGGMLADKFGGKWTLSVGILATAIFTLFTPLAIVYCGSDGLIVLRVLMGLGEGTTFPALSVLLSAWVPVSERGMLGALVLGGGQVGSIAGNLLSGLLLHQFEWPWVFYFFGILAIIWFILFTLLCFSSPATHPFIKPKEREFLLQEIPPKNKDLPGVPWKGIFTNVPMYALISAQIGHDWGFYIMVSCLPKYMADVMRFSIKSNGLYSSLPYVLMWIVSLASGCVADCMITRKCMNTTNTRKVMTAVAAFGPAILMVGASYAGCDRILVVILFTCCMGVMGTYYAGMKLSPLDMSPNYAGTLMALSNGIGSITGVITPFLVGVMTPNTTMQEWRVVFWVAFIVLVVTAIVYCIWASGEIQPFNDGSNSNKKKEAIA